MAYCQNRAVDISLVQEPNTNRGKLVGFETASLRCFLSMGTRRRGRPDYLDYGAAIIVFNPNLVVVPREVGTVENFVSMDLDCGEDGTINIISGYFKYRVPTAVHITALEGLLSSVDGRVLVALDANAFSRRWHSRTDDARGEALVTCIDEHVLAIADVRCNNTTFNGRTSYLDGQ